MNSLSRLSHLIGISSAIILAMAMAPAAMGEPDPPPPCIEYGPHTNGWVCSPLGSAGLSGLVSYTNTTVCVGDTLVPPTLTTNVYPLRGQQTRLIWFDCNGGLNHTETNSFIYTNIGLAFSPSLPASYGSAGTNYYSTWVWICGPTNACETNAYLGVVTVVAVSTAPSIATQPVSQTVNVGASVSFSVVASGCPAPGYQWEFNGVNITGATNATLSLTAVQTNNAGSYTVVVSNSQGSVTSSAATLTVSSPVFTLLYTFSATPSGKFGPFTNLDGANVESPMILAGNALYGVAKNGGRFGYGTIFRIYTNGTGFTNLHNFNGSTDGSVPMGRLTLSGNTLYGTAFEGGTGGGGTLYSVSTNGANFTVLHSFAASAGDGYMPYGGVLLSSNTLYGTADGGGANNYGIVFAISTNGTGFTILHSLDYDEGIYPNVPLCMAGNTLYATCNQGGTNGDGTVFSVNTDGTGFAVLHTFSAIPAYPAIPTNTDGGIPDGGLLVTNNTLYGTASNGGFYGGGTIFSLGTDGTGFTVVHTFTKGSDGSGTGAGLTLSGNTLYGTAYGGTTGFGVIFDLHTDGTGFTTLYNFFLGSDGVNPDYASLVLSGSTLYGSTLDSGGHNNGTLYSLLFIPN